MKKSADRVNLRGVFSKAARTYESAALLQKKIATRLFNNIASKDIQPQMILDVGMGTGFLLRNLAQHYCQAKVMGIDFAFGMNELAKEKGLSVLQAEAKKIPFKNEFFDLVVSNLVYHWVSPLDEALKEVNRVLIKGGWFYFNSFGRQSLRELRFSFCSTRDKRLEGYFNHFFKPVNKKDIQSALEKNNFKKIKITTITQKEYFQDLFTLVKWLKTIGANRIAKPIFMGKKIWQEANEIYLKNFKDNGLGFATFEVIEARAQK